MNEPYGRADEYRFTNAFNDFGNLRRWVIGRDIRLVATGGYPRKKQCGSPGRLRQEFENPLNIIQ